MKAAQALAFLLVLSTTAQVHAQALKLVVPKNGTSPDKKLAVAVFDRPEGQEGTPDDNGVFLVKAESLERLAVLDGVDSDGNYKAAARNVRPAWNPDSKHLIVNWAVGSISIAWKLFRIVDGKPNVIELDPGKEHPKGRLPNLMIGHVYTRSWGEWQDAKTLHIEHVGWDFHTEKAQAALKKLGIGDFDGTLRFVYKHAPDGAWKLDDVIVPSPRPNP